jgi:hypothetical protein
MSDELSEMTSCEAYGHDYVVDESDPRRHVCTDCGESYTEEE